jgi:competence protein ComGC
VNKHIFKNQKGFTLIEIMIVLMLIVGLSITLWPQLEQAMGAGDAAKARTQISEIQNGAMLFKQRNNIFTGITMETLLSQGYVSNRMGTGVGRNPWGGNYTIVPISGNLTQYQIVLSGITKAEIGARLAADYSTSAVAAVFNEGALTLTFQG